MALASQLRARGKLSGSVPVQAWVPPGSHLHFDFQNDRFWNAGQYLTVAQGMTILRTTAAWVENLDGSVKAIAPFHLAMSDRGLKVQSQRTNLVRQNSDLRITHHLLIGAITGVFIDGETLTAAGGGSGVLEAGQSDFATVLALSGGSGTFTGVVTGGTSLAFATISAVALVWVATNATVFKDQVGILGVTNSASRIRADAANATVLQEITSVSELRQGSAYLKRLVGSGAIELMFDGSTWTPVTAALTLGPVSIPAATVTDPSFAIRIVTSGDEVAFDAGMIERGGVGRGSPILTKTAAVQRNGDATYILQSLIPNLSTATFVMEVEWPSVAGVGGIFLEGESSSGVAMLTNSLGTGPRILVRHGATACIDESPSITSAAGDVVRMGAAYDPTAAARTAANGVHTAGSVPSQIDWTGTKIWIGARDGVSNFPNAFIRNLTVYTWRNGPDALTVVP